MKLKQGFLYVIFAYLYAEPKYAAENGNLSATVFVQIFMHHMDKENEYS